MLSSSDESGDSSRGSSRSHSHLYDASEKHEYVSHRDDIYDASRSNSSRSNRSDCGDCGASTNVDTTQEERDRNTLRSDPENKAWMHSQRNLRQCFGYTTGNYPSPLVYSSRLHGLDVSANGHRIEHKFYINVFFRHRWYHGNCNRVEISVMQAWKSLIGNSEKVGRVAWLDKLIAARYTI